jgi:hypothetical protein
MIIEKLGRSIEEEAEEIVSNEISDDDIPF